MSLLHDETALAALLEDLRQQKRPPLHTWDPPHRGHSQMEIKRDGSWWHQGSPIKKASLVRLFSQILRREGEQYFLVTPVEKQEVTVADVPFVALAMERYHTPEHKHPVISFETNVGEKVILSEANPLHMRTTEQGETPYLTLREGIEARLETQVFYECVEYAVSEPTAGKQAWWLYSGDYRALLGEEA